MSAAGAFVDTDNDHREAVLGLDNGNDERFMANAQYFRPIIEALKELGGSASPKEVVPKVIADMQIKFSNDYERKKLERGILWARNTLKNAGLISKEIRGIWSLTDEGRNIDLTVAAANNIQREENRRSNQKKAGSMDPSKIVLEEREPDVDPHQTSHPKNLILYGPPGTGKTYHTMIYAIAIIEGREIDDVRAEAADDFDAVSARFREYLKEGQIAFTTFHQSFSYEEFIEGIRPVVDDVDGASGEVRYRIVDGIFKDFCAHAQSAALGDRADSDGNSYGMNRSPTAQRTHRPCVFIIDEINRGNISKIFGELITLIEESKRMGCREELTSKLPYSRELFGVPDNVYIIGTMNTADRSIARLDTALRRRFTFREMMPEPELLDGTIVDGVNVGEMLRTMNARISVLLGRDRQIGHSYFLQLRDKDNAAAENLADLFDDKILPLLEEYFYDDRGKIKTILGRAWEDFYKSSDIEDDSVFERVAAPNFGDAYIKIYS